MQSLERMRGVMAAMAGKHFHEHLHVVDDVMERADLQDVHYLEIGSYHGCSAAFMASNPRVTSITAIDPMRFEGQEDLFWSNVNKFRLPDVRVSLTKSLSEDADLSGVAPVDVLLIDGCHSFEAVVKDFEKYSPLVRSGGYVLFDDYMDAKFSPKVRKAVDHLVATRLAAGTEFEVIGTYDNDVGAAPAHMRRNNTFILRKLSRTS